MEEGTITVLSCHASYTNISSFVEYETGADLDTAVAKIDGTEFKGSLVHAIADVRSSYIKPIDL